MKLIIDRSKWLRGEGESASYLLRNSDSKRCCVGILCSALGVPDDELLMVKDAINLKLDIQNNLPEWIAVKDLLDISSAYRTNDSLTISESERERTISEIFAKHDIQVEFVG